MSWSSSRPLSGKTGIVSNVYDKPPTQRLESQSRRTSPPLQPYVQATYRRLSRMLAKRNNQSVDLSPRKISSFLRPVKEDLGLMTWGCTAYPVSVVMCTSDELVDLLRPPPPPPLPHKKDYYRHIRLGHPAKSAVAEREFSRDHLIKFQDTRILSTASGCTDRLFREVLELE